MKRHSPIHCAFPGKRLLLLALLGALPAAANAQQPNNQIPVPGGLMGSQAQSGQPSTNLPDGEQDKPGPAWNIIPRLLVGGTATDNAVLSNLNKRSEFITEISPGLRVEGESARLKAYFDYSRRELLYARDSDRQNSRNALNTFGTFKAIDNLLYLDFNGTVSQQAISALGTLSPNSSSTNVNANETEVRSLQLSPYLKSNFGGLFNYELRYSILSRRTSSSYNYSQDFGEWQAKLDGGTRFTNVLWALDASRQNYDFSSARDTESTRMRGKLTYVFSNEFRVFGSAGREENNFISTDQESHNTSGYGLEWRPNARTKLALEQEKRFFGDGHRYTFEHRTARTAFRYSDSRDVFAVPGGGGMGGGSVGNIYDLLFAQLASVEPDPVKRNALVNSYLSANGIAPNTQVTSGFLNSGPTLARYQNLSFALLGARNTLTLLANQSDTKRLSQLSAIGEDLAGSYHLRQRGFGISLAHRISKVGNLNIIATQQKSDSTGASTKIRNLTATYSHTLSPDTTLLLSGRRALFDSPTNPYTESAFIATLRMQF